MVECFFYVGEGENMIVVRNIKKIKWLLIILVVVILSSIFFAYIRDWLDISSGSTESINQSVKMNPLLLVFIILINPVLEEWIFRGKLPILFQRLFPKVEALVLANLVFAIVHCDRFFFPYFVNGCLYSLGYEKTKDLKVPIFAHIFYNLFVFLVSS